MGIVSLKHLEQNKEVVSLKKHLVINMKAPVNNDKMYPPELKTQRFSLTPYSPQDEDRFVEMALDEASIRFMGGASGNELEERMLFKKILEMYKTENERWFWIWGIYKKNLLAGHLELKETEHTKENELEMVYMVHPHERRIGIMTEVLALLKKKQADWQKRLVATVSPDNLGSIALLKKWGIETEEALVDNETGKEYLKLLLEK